MNLGQPVFIEAQDDGVGGDNWTTGAISHAKLQSNHHHQQTNNQIADVCKKMAVFKKSNNKLSTLVAARQATVHWCVVRFTLHIHLPDTATCFSEKLMMPASMVC